MSSETARKLEAATKTVDVLKKRVHSLYNGGQSAIGKQLEAARRRDDDNRRKRELVEVRAAELEKYSRTLEIEVARRTAAIKAIVDNVTFGFLVVGPDLVVRPECTRSCSGLFAQTTVENRPLTELLAMTPRQRDEFRLAIDQVMDDLLPEEVAFGQVRQKYPMASGKVLRAEGRVIRSELGEPTAILFTVSDITALEEATRESAHHRTLVSILKRRDSFVSFLAETREQLVAAREAASSGNGVFVRRVVHTVKGNSASYGLGDVVDVIHDLEEAASISTDDLGVIERSVRAFLERNREVLEIDYEDASKEAFKVSKHQLAQLREIIAQVSGGASDELRDWSARVHEKPASSLIGPLQDFTERLADRLGKQVDLTVVGEAVLVDAAMRPVFQSLTHLIRNAVDHGIEPAGERGDKPERGRILVEVSVSPSDQCHVIVEDDGRGIDLPKLRERAVAKGMLSRAEVDALRDGGIELIFLDGLSAADVTTNISGRGVGMSAVRSAALTAGGTMTVASVPGRGTRFTVSVPRAVSS